MSMTVCAAMTGRNLNKPMVEHFRLSVPAGTPMTPTLYAQTAGRIQHHCRLTSGSTPQIFALYEPPCAPESAIDLRTL